jgi:hypothetical protein
MNWGSVQTPNVGPAFLGIGIMILIIMSGSGIPGPSTPGGDALALSGPSDFHTTINGNFSIPSSEPSELALPGAYLFSQLRVTVASAPTNLSGGLTVWIPETAVTFAVANASLRTFHAAETLNFTLSGAPLSPVLNATILVKSPTQFNSSSPAMFSSQLASVMSSEPYGSVILTFGWRWALVNPDGSTLFGRWTANTSVVPAMYAELASYGPTVLRPGGWFSVCVWAPGTTRNFALHLETVTPYDDFTQVNATTPANATSPSCWSAQVASWVTPQTILAHVWNYDRVTLLLYIIKVSVANATQSPLGSLAFLDTPTGGVDVACLVLALGPVVWAVRQRERRAKTPPPEAKGP